MSKRSNVDMKERSDFSFDTQEEKKMTTLPKFRKTAEVVDHVLVVNSVKFVESVFGQTFYLNVYDDTSSEHIIITGGSVALLSQLSGVDDLGGMRLVIRQRGKSYELQEADSL